MRTFVQIKALFHKRGGGARKKSHGPGGKAEMSLDGMVLLSSEKEMTGLTEKISPNLK